MKKAKRGLILLLIISTFLCQSCAGNGLSTEPEQTTEVSIQNDSVSDLANEWVTAEDIIARGHVSLAYEYMNEASIAYNNEDGSKTLYVFSQSVNYIDEHMKWSFIDTGIKEVDETRMANMGYQYTIEASDIKTYYPENLSPDLGVSLQKQLYQFGAVGDHNYAAEIVQKENFIQENREMIAYKGAVEGSDLFVYPSTLGTNAEIQIAQPFAKNQFQLWLEVEENMDVVKQPGGYLTIEARNNDETTIVGVIQKPLLKSAEGKYSYDSAIRSVRKTDHNRYVITFTINDEFNSSGTNVFLAFEVRREKQPDNCLYSKKLQLTHAYLANYSVIGNSSEYGIGRLMLRYVFSSLNIESDAINSATYKIYALNNVDAEIELRPVLEDWCSITGNWNNNYKTGEAISKFNFQDHIWTFDITGSVKEWFADETEQLEHNGLQLKYVNESDQSSIVLSNDNSLFMNVTILNFDD